MESLLETPSSLLAVDGSLRGPARRWTELSRIWERFPARRSYTTVTNTRRVASLLVNPSTQRTRLWHGWPTSSSRTRSPPVLQPLETRRSGTCSCGLAAMLFGQSAMFTHTITLEANIPTSSEIQLLQRLILLTALSWTS